MIAHALQVAGAPTVQCPAAVRTEAPVPQRMGAASVPLASEDPYVREVRLGPHPRTSGFPFTKPLLVGSAGLWEAGLWELGPSTPCCNFLLCTGYSVSKFNV